MIEAYQKIIAWVSAMTDATVFVRFPNAPMPPKPCVSVKITAVAEQANYRAFGDDDDYTDRWMTFTLSLQVHGRNPQAGDSQNVAIAKSLEAETITQQILDRLTDLELREDNLLPGITFNSVLSTSDISAVIGTEYESRYQVDLAMSATRRLMQVTDASIIERWEVGGIVNNAVNKIPVDGASLDLDFIENEFSTQNAFNDVNFRQVAVEAQIDGYQPTPEDGE